MKNLLRLRVKPSPVDKPLDQNNRVGGDHTPADQSIKGSPLVQGHPAIVSSALRGVCETSAKCPRVFHVLMGQIPHRARTLSVLLTLSTCMSESQALALDGRGGPSLKTSDLPSRAMWYELFSLVASA